MKLMYLFIATFMFSCTQTTKTETGSAVTDSISLVTPPTVEPKDTLIKNETTIESIRAAVQNINNKTLQVQTFNWSAPACADEGTIRYFLDGETINKVVETGFIGDGGWVKEYYYQDGSFIFSYMRHIGGAAGMPVDTSEIREYVHADTLVLLIRNKELHDDIKQKFNNKSREYKLLASLKNKDFAKVLCN